jgi:hypothetical protein
LTGRRQAFTLLLTQYAESKNPHPGLPVRSRYPAERLCIDRVLSRRISQSAEDALLKIIADLDRLSADANAEQKLTRLLHEFDVVTGLSAWSDPHQVH